MKATEDKGLRFVLTACGIDPETVVLHWHTHDYTHVECEAGDEHAVQTAIKLWMKHRSAYKNTFPGLEKYRDLMNTKK